MMTQQELYRYKLNQGARAAADLLLLVGPDDFDGDYIVDLDIVCHTGAFGLLESFLYI